MKKKFEINLWDHVNIENVNGDLDKVTEKENHIASDIHYKCVKITKNGVITLEATYTPEEY